MVRTATIVAAIVIMVPLLRARTYTSVSTFIPQQSRSSSGGSNLNSIAAQFGVNLSTPDPMQNSSFYADLLKSEEVLRTIAAMTYEVKQEGRTVQKALVDIMDVPGPSAAERAARTADLLRQQVAASPAIKTGVITLTTTATSPALAQALNLRLLDQLNKFNLERRQSQAEAERVFTERRLGEVKSELRQAEDRVQAFLQSNREFRNDPQLMFQYDRLTREVSLRQQVVNALAQAYEQSRIDRVRDTPVITVIDRPTYPFRPNSRHMLLMLVLGILAGIVAALILALVREMMSGDVRADDEDVRIRREAREDLRRPWRLWLGGRAASLRGA